MDDFDWRVAKALRVLFLVVFLLYVLFMSYAHAAGPDFSPLTEAVDYSTAIAAILLVMAGLAGGYIVMAAGNLILQKLRDPDYDADFAEWDSRR